MDNQLIQVQNKIYEIRGVKVMLDFDLAEMYGVETKVLNQSVKRNIRRFPDDFMFQLANEEYSNLKSQIVTSSWGGTRKLPYAFTEQGVAMLSGLLNSDIAIEMNIVIMRAFVAVRRFVLSPPVQEAKELRKEVNELKYYIEEVLSDYNDINEDTRMQLELIYQLLAELQVQKRLAEKPRMPIGFRQLSTEDD